MEQQGESLNRASNTLRAQTSSSAVWKKGVFVTDGLSDGRRAVVCGPYIVRTRIGLEANVDASYRVASLLYYVRGKGRGNSE